MSWDKRASFFLPLMPATRIVLIICSTLLVFQSKSCRSLTPKFCGIYIMFWVPQMLPCAWRRLKPVPWCQIMAISSLTHLSPERLWWTLSRSWQRSRCWQVSWKLAYSAKWLRQRTLVIRSVNSILPAHYLTSKLDRMAAWPWRER